MIVFLPRPMRTDDDYHICLMFCHLQEVEVVVVAVVVGVVVEVVVVEERYQIDDARFHVFPLDLTKNWKDAGAGIIFSSWQFQRK